jgi:hypothetical protein
MLLLDFAANVLVIASIFSSQGTGLPQSTPSTVIRSAGPLATEQMLEIHAEDYTTRDTLAPYVRDYFSDVPVLVEIARCESTFRHLGKDGDVLRGIVNRADLGVMQINELYHGERAKKLGFDLHTIEGNLAYARFLYEREGVQPWSSSAKCWSKTTAYKTLTAQTAQL